MGVTSPQDYNPLPYVASLLWIAAVAVARLVLEGRDRRVVAAGREPVAVG